MENIKNEPFTKGCRAKKQAKRRTGGYSTFSPKCASTRVELFQGAFISQQTLSEEMRQVARIFVLHDNERRSSIRRIVQQWATSTNLLYCQAAGERSIPGNGTTRRHLHRDWFSPPTQTKESPLSTDAVAQIALFKLLPPLNHPNTPLMSYFIIYGFGRGEKNCKIT